MKIYGLNYLNVFLLILYVLLGSILFFIPLYFSLTLVTPFLVTKAFLFTLLVEISCFFYLLLILFAPSYRPKNNSILYTFLFFVAVSSISGIFGANPEFSFWSSAHRCDGVLILIHVFLFFLITACVVKKEKLLNILLSISAISSVLVALSIYIKYIDLASFHFWNNIDALGGVLGSDSFAGSYLLFNLFFILYLIFNSPKKSFRYFWEFCAFFIIFSPTFLNFDIFKGLVSFGDLIHHPMLLIGSARGAAISLVVGFTMFVPLLFIQNQDNKLIKNTARLFFGGVFAATLICFIMIFVSGNPIHRWFGEKTDGYRFIYWHQAWEGFKDKPFLGWGPGNFELVNQKYFDPSVLNDDYIMHEVSSDKAHSIIMDTLVDVGIVGFLSYASIYIFTLFVLWKSKNIYHSTKAIFTGLLIAYILQNLILFDTIFSYLMFAFLLSIIIILDRGFANEDIVKIIIKNFNAKIALIPLIFLSLIFSIRYYIFLPFKETFYNYQFYSLPRAVRGFFVTNREFSNFGTSVDAEVYAYVVYNQYSQDFDIIKNKKNNNSYVRDINAVINDIIENSKDTGLTFFGAHMVFLMYDLNYQITGDKSLLEKMFVLSDMQRKMAPNDPRGYIDKARVYYFQNKYKDSLDTLEKALALNVHNTRVNFLIVEVARLIGDKKLLAEKVMRARINAPDLKYQ